MEDKLQVTAIHETFLSDEDDRALRQSASDLSDLDPLTILRAKDGFRRAYETARRVTEGTLDPLSAG